MKIVNQKRSRESGHIETIIGMVIAGAIVVSTLLIIKTFFPGSEDSVIETSKNENGISNGFLTALILLFTVFFGFFIAVFLRYRN
ncbi:MAG: hypothetical protein WC087_02940 [Candidatus Paceibacterota bacterium]